MQVDRHRAAVEALRVDLLSAPGATTREERARVLAGESPTEMRDFLEKVRHSSYRITAEDVDALRRAGVSEDVIFELTVAAAVGAALERLEAAKRAIAPV